MRLALPALLLLAALLPPSGSARAQGHAEAKRIVSVGGTVTEILFAIGAGERIVAVDTTSYYPEEATRKPDVGYMRQLSAEGILAQKPDLIIAEASSGPPDTLQILKASGVPIVMIDASPAIEAIGPRIRSVGEAVGLGPSADELARKVEADLEMVRKVAAARTGPRKKVLFTLSLANGRIMAAGSNTSADAMIGLAGGVNVGAGFSGYKPMADEAVIAAAPEALVVMRHSALNITPEQAFAIPSLKSSPAGQTGTFISMDGLFLLGLGPRTAEAAREFASKLYPEAAKP